ncbi:hypothetical protein HDV64DRAFT_36387 [Trichoderma sp. TUCIM 5745]
MSVCVSRSTVAIGRAQWAITFAMQHAALYAASKNKSCELKQMAQPPCSCHSGQALVTVDSKLQTVGGHVPHWVRGDSESALHKQKWHHCNARFGPLTY